MARKKNEFGTTLEELLELSQIPLNEAEEDDDKEVSPFDLPSDIKKDAEDKKDDADDSDDSEDDSSDEEDDGPEEELHDEWEKTLRTGSKLKIAFHENYVYIWYRNKRSPKIKIPDLLRKNRKLVSGLFEELLSHVEKVS